MERPWLKFYTRDWLGDSLLRRCSLQARSLLIDLMCLAHEGDPYGYLSDGGGPFSAKYMANRCYISMKQFNKCTEELVTLERLHRNESGTLHCKRMVEDEELRAKRAVGGYKSSGNPILTSDYNKPGFIYLIRRSSDKAVKIGIAINPKTRIWKLKSSMHGQDLDVIATIEVDNMGEREAVIHHELRNRRVHGEWFFLSEDEIESVITSLKGSSPTSLNGTSKAGLSHAHTRALTSDSDSGISFQKNIQESTENPAVLEETEVRFGSWDMDESYLPLVELYRNSGKPVIEDDFADAWWPWKLLDFEQKQQRFDRLKHNLDNRLYSDPNFIPAPRKFIEREWKRELRAANGANPGRESVAERAARARKEAKDHGVR